MSSSLVIIVLNIFNWSTRWFFFFHSVSKVSINTYFIRNGCEWMHYFFDLSMKMMAIKCVHHVWKNEKKKRKKKSLKCHSNCRSWQNTCRKNEERTKKTDDINTEEETKNQRANQYSILSSPFHFISGLNFILLTDNENGQCVTIYYVSRCFVRGGLEDERIYFLLSITNPGGFLPLFISIELASRHNTYKVLQRHTSKIQPFHIARHKVMCHNWTILLNQKTLCTRIHESPLLSITHFLNILCAMVNLTENIDILRTTDVHDKFY